MMNWMIMNMETIAIVSLVLIATALGIIAILLCCENRQKDDYIDELEFYAKRLRRTVEDRDDELYILKCTTAYEPKITKKEGPVTVNE